MEKIKRLMNLYLSPTETLSEVKEKSDWLFPGIVLLISAVIYAVLIIPITMPAQIEAYKNNPDLTVEQKNALIEGAQGIFPYIGGAVGAILMTVLILFIMAGFVILIRFIFGGNKVGFKHVFSAVAYISTINLLSYIFGLIVTYATGDLIADISINLLFPGLSSSYLGRVIGGISVFGVWQAVLYSLLLIVFYNYSKVKAFSIMGVSYLILLLITAISIFPAA
ncbi:MAG: YIP1 family protein [Halanaerobiales bacterium]